MEEVLIKVRGMQSLEEQHEEPIEVVSVGQKYEEDGFMCIAYDEVVDATESGVVQVAKNLLKIKEGQVEVIKEGAMETHMVFIPNKSTYSYFSTPFGELEVSVSTSKIVRTPTEKGFQMQIYYNLEMNQQFLSKCKVDLTVEFQR